MSDSETNASNQTEMPKRSLFDEEGYLQLYPDIAEGVASGALTLMVCVMLK